MTINIDSLLRNAKAEIKAGRPQIARAEMLKALERFPDNTRLLAQLAEAQEAVSRLPAPLASHTCNGSFRSGNALFLPRSKIWPQRHG